MSTVSTSVHVDTTSTIVPDQNTAIEKVSIEGGLRVSGFKNICSYPNATKLDMPLDYEQTDSIQAAFNEVNGLISKNSLRICSMTLRREMAYSTFSGRENALMNIPGKISSLHLVNIPLNLIASLKQGRQNHITHLHIQNPGEDISNFLLYAPQSVIEITCTGCKLHESAILSLRSLPQCKTLRLGCYRIIETPGSTGSLNERLVKAFVQSSIGVETRQEITHELELGREEEYTILEFSRSKMDSCPSVKDKKEISVRKFAILLPTLIRSVAAFLDARSHVSAMQAYRNWQRHLSCPAAFVGREANFYVFRHAVANFRSCYTNPALKMMHRALILTENDMFMFERGIFKEMNPAKVVELRYEEGKLLIFDSLWGMERLASLYPNMQQMSIHLHHSRIENFVAELNSLSLPELRSLNIYAASDWFQNEEFINELRKIKKPALKKLQVYPVNDRMEKEEQVAAKFFCFDTNKELEEITKGIESL